MASLNADMPLLPSLLDRLIDQDPDKPADDTQSNSRVIAAIKNGVRRDLENLLNTRLHRQEVPENLEELKQSVVTYGVPDFSMVPVHSDAGLAFLKDALTDAIYRYEPRMQQVRIELMKGVDLSERTLYLQISAVLMVEPDAIPLVFDTYVRPSDKSVDLQDADYG